MINLSMTAKKSTHHTWFISCSHHFRIRTFEDKKKLLVYEWLTHTILTFGFVGIAHNLFSQCIDKQNKNGKKISQSLSCLRYLFVTLTIRWFYYKTNKIHKKSIWHKHIRTHVCVCMCDARRWHLIFHSLFTTMKRVWV